MELFVGGIASRIALASSGIFFMAGLLTGYWKYRCMRALPGAEAPFYVNTAHRAALMYAFAGQLLAVFAGLSPFPGWLNAAAVSAPIIFFAISILHYVNLGFTSTTDNSLRDSANPRKDYLLLDILSAAEIGGFAVLLIGFFARG